MNREWLEGLAEAATSYLEARDRLAEFITLDDEEAPAEEEAPALVYTAKEVRAWAAAAHMECPSRGVIPRHIVEAYLENAAEVRS